MSNSDQSNDFYIELGNRIRQSRLTAQVGQEELAEQLGLTRASIVNIEKGRQRPMIHTLLTICDLLKVELHELLPGQKRPTQIQKEEFSSWSDFSDVISDEFTIDPSTQSAVKKFVSSLK